MSKSISKLIIAGMAVALAVPVGANAQEKAMKRHANARANVTSTVQALPANAKKVEMMESAKARTFETKGASQLAQAGKITRPMNFKLDRQRAPMHVTASEPVNGMVIFADNWNEEYLPYGVYSFPTDGGSNEPTQIALVDDMAGAAAGVAAGDRYYTSTIETFWGFILGAYVSVYDMNTWELVETVDVIDNLEKVAVSYAYDYTTDKVYGQFYTADLSGMYFGEFNPATLEVTPIAVSGQQYNVLAFSPEGVLYAIAMDGNLYTVDPATGNETLIGATGYYPQYLSGGAIDQKSGRFYWNICTDEAGVMAEVDVTTGQATILYQLPWNEEVVGMWVPKPAAEEGAPNQVSDLDITFADGALDGTITFKAPTTKFDGSELSGNLTYVVKVNGEQVTTGTVAAGAEVTYNYTAAESGSYRFTVYCVNEVGDGAPTSVTLYVGVDSALNPTNVELTYADQKMTLTWDAVKGAHNGYLGNVTYTVTRYESGKEPVVVAEGLTECTYTETFVPEDESLRDVYYTVKAVTSEGTTAAVASNVVGMGCVLPPYSHSFVNSTSLEGYTIIDGNGDNKVWTLAGKDGLRMSYNSSKDMDDWCITPAVKLEAGKYYQYSIVVANNSKTYAERIEVKAGKAPTADAMTMQVIAPTTVQTNSENLTLTSYITPDETGEYYIGIHGMSDPDQFYLYVREYSISEGALGGAPAQIGDFTVAGSENNFFEAAISFTVPATTIAGETLSSVDKVEITRDGEVVFAIENPTPGQEITITDPVPASATYTYVATAYNSVGASFAAQKTVYVGVPIAEAVTDAKVEATATVGEVTISWEPTTKSTTGFDIPAQYITYTIVDKTGAVLVAGLTDCSYTYQAVTEGQAFVYYGIYAVTDAGNSARATTSMIAVGTPYELPFVESFNDAGLSYIWGTTNHGTSGQWSIADNSMFSDVDDADNSNGFAYMKASYLYDCADLFSGLITLNAEAPALKFAYYNLSAADTNTIDVLVTCDGVENTVATFVMNEGPQIGWCQALVALNEYAGKTVQVNFRATANALTYTLIDAISIDQLEDYNLELTSVNGPAKVKANEEFSITADVYNMGAKTTSDYTLELYYNGNLIAVKNGAEIATGEKASFVFNHTLNVTAPEENIYGVKLVSDVDPYTEDNYVEFPVILTIPNYPTARELQATLLSGNNGVELTWAEPDMENLPKEAVTEDFEEYAAFTTNDLGEWTLVDEDGFVIGGVQGVEFGNGAIVPGETACAYFLMNDTEYSSNEAYLAHSGHQYLVSTFSYKSEGANADWLISPELSGDAQTITFYAKSFSSQYGLEDCKVLYSTTDKDITSFTEVETYIGVPVDWTAFTVDLPAGAKYFAIECISNDKFMMFVDDVTYEPANGAGMELSIVGYNIYRNGVKINDAPVADTNFIDAEGTTSDLYCVSVVYTIGESGPSLIVGVGNPTGVNDLVAGAASVKVADHTIVVANAEGTVTVYAADGKTIYSEAAAQTNSVVVTPGVYVVKAGEMVTKVIVK